MCQGAVNVHGQAICNCHLPSQVEGPKLKQSEKASPSVDELLRSAVSATAEAPNRAVKRRVRQRLHKKLGAILNKEEFDRAMENFHVAVEAQRLQHEEELRSQKRGQAAAGTLLAGTVNPVNRVGAAKPGPNAPAFVAVPVVMVPTNGQPGRAVPMPCGTLPQPVQPGPNGWNMPGAVLCAVQDVKQVQERVRIPQMPMKTGPVPQKAGPVGLNFCGQPNGFYAAPQAADESDSDKSIGQGVTFQRARSEGEVPGENLPVERTFIQFSSAGDSSKRSRSQ